MAAEVCLPIILSLSFPPLLSCFLSISDMQPHAPKLAAWCDVIYLHQGCRGGRRSLTLTPSQCVTAALLPPGKHAIHRNEHLPGVEEREYGCCSSCSILSLWVLLSFDPLSVIFSLLFLSSASSVLQTDTRGQNVSENRKRRTEREKEANKISRKEGRRRTVVAVSHSRVKYRNSLSCKEQKSIRVQSYVITFNNSTLNTLKHFNSSLFWSQRNPWKVTTTTTTCRRWCVSVPPSPGAPVAPTCPPPGSSCSPCSCCHSSLNTPSWSPSTTGWRTGRHASSRPRSKP